MSKQDDPTANGAPSEPFLWRAELRNYKSIKACRVDFKRLTVLVGRNGSGKSNFLDALRFVLEALQTSLDNAIRTRGGIEGVRRRSTGHPHNFQIRLLMNLLDRRSATYEFEIGAKKEGGFCVKSEQLTVGTVGYRVENGAIVSPTESSMPPATSDRLYLVVAAGLQNFRPVYDGLMSMGFYNLNPEVMKKPQSPDAGELLHRDGDNIASVLARMSMEQSGSLERIREFLTTIVPGIKEVRRVAVGSWETLEFTQEVQGSNHPWRFYATSMSDGTLRTLGNLVAVTQNVDRKSPVRLVGIEEPETALHPAASAALMEALREAARHTQIVVTTHSPDLLDQIELDTDALVAVHSNQGTTELGPVDEASRKMIREKLYSPGELLRMDQMSPTNSGELTFEEISS